MPRTCHARSSVDRCSVRPLGLALQHFLCTLSVYSSTRRLDSLCCSSRTCICVGRFCLSFCLDEVLMSNTPLYDALRSPRSPRAPRDESPPYSRTSNESEESLRALELSEGPLLADSPRSRSRARTYSVSGFDFENELLPLSASISEREDIRTEPREKHIGLLNGVLHIRIFALNYKASDVGIALCVGLQVRVSQTHVLLVYCSLTCTDWFGDIVGLSHTHISFILV